jgi:hypothetical protein
LINTLLGETVQLTGAIREDDGKGRHVTTGRPDARRLSSFRKLIKEQAFNSATLAEKRARDKSFGKLIKAHLSDKNNRKG